VFWYDVAPDFDVSDNAVFSIDSTRNEQNNWQTQSVNLIAENDIMNLSFGAFGTENTLGGLVDNVSLVKISDAPITSVPEPTPWLVALLPILYLTSRKASNSLN
jgi:hypothetical protein